MRYNLCALALIAAPWPGVVHASDLIVTPPADIAAAYSHPEMATTTTSRALSASPDGRLAAYVVQHPVKDPGIRTSLFLPTGAPVMAAEGARISLLDLRTRISTRICPSVGNDWNPIWSPDGTRLAFYSDRDGEARLWVYTRESGTCRRVAERPAKSLLWAHEEPRWSNDGRLIYYATWPERGAGSAAEARAPLVATPVPSMAAGDVRLYRHVPATNGGEGATAAGPPATNGDFRYRCTSGRHLAASLAVVPSDGSAEARVLADAEALSAEGSNDPHYPSAYFRLSASGRWLTYFDIGCTRADDPTRYAMRLLAIPAQGGTPVVVADNLRIPMGIDENALNYRWSPVADELVYTRDSELWRVRFDSSGPTAAERLGAELGALSPALHWYSEDGMRVLVGTNPVNTGRDTSPFARDIDLAMIPAAGGAPVRIALDRTRWAITGVVARDDRTLLQPGPATFRLFGTDKGTGENVILTFDWPTGETRVTWRARGRIHAIQPGVGGFVGIYEDFRTPANLFAFSPHLKKFERLTDIMPEARRAATGSTEMFETVIPQHDGSLRTVRTAVLLPEGARRGDRLPAVVWFYPGSDGTRSVNTFGAPLIGDPAYLFTSRGYAVVIANVAIGPGEERGHVIDEIMDSLMPQVHRAADLGYVDISRLALRGSSFGGFGTAAVVARTNLFRAAIPSSGVYDLAGGYGQVDYVRGGAIDGSIWSERGQPRLGQSPWADPLRYIENSPYYLADRIRTPMLILQGTDDFTGSRESGKLFAALRRLDRPVELALYGGGGHTPAHFPLTQAVDQMARTLDFLRRYIGEGWSSGKASGPARPIVQTGTPR
jgi:dipeptidyl aminopeptidase/acylaminoacyl peptidase